MPSKRVTAVHSLSKLDVLVACALCLLTAAIPAGATGMALVDIHHIVSVRYDEKGGTPLFKSAELLSHNLEALSGTKPIVGTLGNESTRSPTVIIGLASSPKTSELLKAHHVSTAPHHNGSGYKFLRASC